jgi:methionyl-tRNA formyltransferase
MGADMRIAFLSAEDPIYLPSFFEIVLSKVATQTECVYLVPPLYKGQSRAAAAWRYYRTFGLPAVLWLFRELAGAKAARRSIKHVCAQHSVRHAEISDVNATVFVEELERLQLDVIISVSCPQIFRSRLLNAPALGCLNIHGALLPEYRGIMPSFWMLANGERRGGVTVYFMNEAIDAGDVAAQRVVEILPEDSLDGYLRRSKAVSADLLLEVLASIEQGTEKREPMEMMNGSYYSWPDPDAVRRFRRSGRKLW